MACGYGNLMNLSPAEGKRRKVLCYAFSTCKIPIIYLPHVSLAVCEMISGYRVPSKALRFVCEAGDLSPRPKQAPTAAARVRHQRQILLGEAVRESSGIGFHLLQQSFYPQLKRWTRLQPKLHHSSWEHDLDYLKGVIWI